MHRYLCALVMVAALPAQAFPVERCMNLSNYLEVERGGDWTYPFDPAHISEIARAGFDTLRVPARVADYFTGGAIDPAFADRLRSVIERARAEGLFVILDLHHFDALMDDPAAHADRFVAIWAALAEMFDDMPDGLVFELLNEPHATLTSAGALPLYARALAEIRARQPDRWVIYGGGDWNALPRLSDLPPTDDPRVIHTFHYYTPDAFTHQGAFWRDDPPPVGTTWGTAEDHARLQADFERAAAHHTPSFLGEFGVFEAAPRDDRIAWIKAVREAAGAHGIGWCHWGFGAGFGAFEPADNAWDEDILGALID